MDNEEIISYFQDLYDNNKYLIKIYNTIDANWVIYMFKNQHIQLDTQTNNSLKSTHIDIQTIVEYISNQNSDIKIAYTCYYDDFEEYKAKISCILNKIKSYYDLEGKKEIKIKYRIYWN